MVSLTASITSPFYHLHTTISTHCVPFLLHYSYTTFCITYLFLPYIDAHHDYPPPHLPVQPFAYLFHATEVLPGFYTWTHHTFCLHCLTVTIPLHTLEFCILLFPVHLPTFSHYLCILPFLEWSAQLCSCTAYLPHTHSLFVPLFCACSFYSFSTACSFYTHLSAAHFTAHYPPPQGHDNPSTTVPPPQSPSPWSSSLFHSFPSLPLPFTPHRSPAHHTTRCLLALPTSFLPPPADGGPTR